MKFLQVVPDEKYFHWQLWAQMANFRHFFMPNGNTYEQHALICVAIKPGATPSEEIQRFSAWTCAQVIYYEDTRNPTPYISTIRPHILKKLWIEWPELGRETIFYHDSDIVFTRPIDVQGLEEGEMCYVGDAHSYLNVYYLKRFTNWQYYAMCDIVGITPQEVEENDTGAGGAQYVIKGVNAAYWGKVEKDCDQLYRFLEHATKQGLREFNPHAPLTKYHITTWCSDMWAVLWNLWYIGKKTELHKDLSFTWPADDINGVYKNAVIHNAGIDGSNYTDNKTGKPHLFCKTHFHGHYPYDEDLSFVKPDTASYIYASYIKNAKLLRNNFMNHTRRFKVLAIACTTNKVHAHIFTKHQESILKAVQATTLCDVTVKTCSHFPIENNLFDGYTVNFHDLGHLNYILQIRKVMAIAKNEGKEYDIVCFLEHDCLYPPQYFDDIVKNWSGAHYGVTYDNYEGVSRAGWQRVIERHQPFSVMALSYGFAWDLFNYKIDEYLVQGYKDQVNNDYPFGPMGWCCIEPDNKDLLYRIPFTGFQPAIHVNTFGEKFVHHLTGHGICCYSPEPWTDTHPFWGKASDYFPPS